ncbi:MAG: sensor histidine kinase [Alphaproteobacteria bacterium]|nr:sensor histidine kinase [Alphaproteobacteria bacterium]
MTPEQLEAAMIRHNKGEQSTGAGLGLAIVSEIAQELGLSFEMHSRPGKGSVAFLYLPLTP